METALVAAAELITAQPAHADIVCMEDQVLLRPILPDRVRTDLILRQRINLDPLRLRPLPVIPLEIDRDQLAPARPRRITQHIHLTHRSHSRHLRREALHNHLIFRLR